ncbi:MAG: tyrosine--tRNA ligase [bacterium]|nr:tyrosine--tRNA ligase [bacterium]
MDFLDELKAIEWGTIDLISQNELIDLLKESKQENRPLRIKFGVDPTAPDIHLGHTVVLRKLRAFQELGHEVIFLIGDFTAQIGDPSGKSKTRIRLSPEKIAKNSQTYQEQVFKILDPKKTQVVYNSSWLCKMNLHHIIKLTSLYTVARMLERDDFKNRYEAGKEITILEFLYPLLQGYDSVEIKADIEIGGTEQKFNLLVGRALQKEYGQKPQVVLTLPILEGTDGVRKMSKSYNNYIGIFEPPKEIFGKIMSIPDHIMLKYYQLLTDISEGDLNELRESLKNGQIHPKEAKKDLAKNIISFYYSQQIAAQEEKEFEKIFKYRKLPDELEEYKIDTPNKKLADIIVEAKIAKSKGEARRLISQGAVKINQNKVIEIDYTLNLKEETTLQVGKRRFIRLT